jgi:hypothetical protein
MLFSPPAILSSFFPPPLFTQISALQNFFREDFLEFSLDEISLGLLTL